MFGESVLHTWPIETYGEGLISRITKFDVRILFYDGNNRRRRLDSISPFPFPFLHFPVSISPFSYENGVCLECLVLLALRKELNPLVGLMNWLVGTLSFLEYT